MSISKKELYAKYENALEPLTVEEVIQHMFNHFSTDDLKEFYVHITDEEGLDHG